MIALGGPGTPGRSYVSWSQSEEYWPLKFEHTRVLIDQGSEVRGGG